MNYFIIALIVSTIQSLVITNSSSILGTFENIFLLLGLRLFVSISPLITILFRNWELFASVSLIFLGMSSILLNFKLFGAIVLSSGFSISSFILRRRSIEEYSNASRCRIAFNLGNILSGLILIVIYEKFVFWATCFAGIIYAMFKSKAQKTTIVNPTILPKGLTQFSLKNFPIYLVWIFFGIPIGIQTYLIPVILTQHLSHIHGEIPKWFGLIICSSSILTILSLLPKYKNENFSKKIIYFYLIFTGLMIASLKIFNLKDLYSLSIFILISSPIGGFFSQIVDIDSAKDQAFLVKEVSAGIGAGLAVLIMRATHNSIIVGSISILFCSIAYILNHHFSKKQKKSSLNLL